MQENKHSPTDNIKNNPTKASSADKKQKRARVIISVVFLIILALIIIIPAGIKFSVGKYADKKLSSLLNNFKDPCYVIYENSDYDIFSNNFTVSNLSVLCMEEEAARFGEISFNNIKHGKPLPANITAEIKNGIINVDAKVFGKYGKLASKLGYGPIPVSGSVMFTMGQASKIFRIEQLDFVSPGLGRLQGEFQIDNVNAYSFTGALQQILANDYTNLWISFTDDGFVEKTISRYAATIESDEKTAKSRALHGIERRISNKYKDDPHSREQLVQIYRFIENPSVLTAKFDGGDTSILSTVESLNYNGWRSFVHSISGFTLTLHSN